MSTFMKAFKIFYLSILLWCLTGVYAHAQADKPLPKIDTYIKAQSKRHMGMFNIYFQDNKYFMEIPDKLLGRDVLTSIIIIKASAQRKRDPAMRFGFAGDAVNDRVVRFRKDQGDKINIVEPLFVQATDTANMYVKAVNSTLLPSLFSFDILAVGTSSSLVDITSLFEGDADLFSLKAATVELNLGSYDSKKSKILGVSTFENNIVFRSVKSYREAMPKQQGAPQQDAPSDPEISVGEKTTRPEATPTIWEVGASWYLLPEKPMQQRIADKRVGYFQTNLRDYDQNPERNNVRAFANRWRIEPKPEDMQKYRSGELVEPSKPIVFYIDRNAPAYLIPYMIAGVNAWAKSFEKIGFKNAIIGKLEPTAEEDPQFTMEDARYSYISYKPSEMANAYGPQIVDPRSGEILTSHVAVFHNIMELLQRWYFSMCAATDPEARNIPMNKELMGRLMKNVITHEVGHTLGLRHNFAGSSSYPVDSLRNRDFVRKNSLGPSVMDYMRFNYVAQPEDKMDPKDLLPFIGVYDDYAIEWGYRYFPQFNDEISTADYLRKWVTEKRKDGRYFYYEEGVFNDPRVQSEDLGDNSMKANALGVKNLETIMSNINKWGAGNDDSYTTLRSMYRAVQGRYYNYLQHVVKNIAGWYSDNALRDEGKSNFIPTTKANEKEALAYLEKYMFTEPKWLYPPDILAKTKFNFTTDVEQSYGDLLGRVINKMSSLSTIQNVSGSDNYTPVEYIDDLYNIIFKNFDSAAPISRYDQMMQRNYIEKIVVQANFKGNNYNNIGVKLTDLLLLTAKRARIASDKQTDFVSKSHLKAIADFIEVWYTGSKNTVISK